MESPDRRDGQHENKLFLQVVLIVGCVFIVWVLFALARSIYRDSFLVVGYINQLQERISIEEQALAGQQDELAYARTPQFQEKAAKTFLGLRQPGEEVIMLTHEEQSIENLLPETRARSAGRELLSPPEKWLRYLFGI